MTNDTTLEILKGSLSFLPEDELTSIITAVKNARKNKKKQELINVSLGEIAEKIKHVE